MKSRFSSLDVSANVHYMQRLIGSRLANIYDLNSKTFLFKFSTNDEKTFLLIESGMRFHTTQFARDKGSPGGFTMKLRKHLRTRKLTSFVQLGNDRTIDLQFGLAENAHHIIVEFYAAGNIILTDHEYRILSLLRTVDLENPQLETEADGPSKESIRIAVGEIYPTSMVQIFSPMTETKLLQILHSATDVSTQEATVTEAKMKKDVPSKSKKSKEFNLRKVLRDKIGVDYSPPLIDHCIQLSGLDPNTLIQSLLSSETKSEDISKLVKAFQQGDEIVYDCIKHPAPGYITLKEFSPNQSQTPLDKDTADNQEFITYEEFHPYLFRQLVESAKPSLSPRHFDSFDKAVDEFYSQVEAQKLELKARQAELAAAKKLDSVKQGHITQIRNLELAQQNNQLFALAIETNLHVVDSVLSTIRGFLASGMDWVDLDDLIREEQRKGNALAKTIQKLKLETGLVTIALPNPNFELEEDDDSSSDEDSETLSDQERQPTVKSNQLLERRTVEKKKNIRKDLAQDVVSERVLKIDLDIYSSSYANARRYYDAKKVAAVKQDKTLEASEKAIKIAQRKIEQDLNSVQKTSVSITKMRKSYWFEKFLWFISSENFLVVGGHDAAQNELLVKRYMRKGDVYIHADLPGAASVIVKNLNSLNTVVPLDSLVGTSEPKTANGPPVNEENPVPPTTLLQAGTMSVCQSRAWDAKIVTSAYWVHSHQVSKTAPTGEYLTTGSFMIRGKKNWLPPVQLVYGIGLLFKIDESGMARHYWERRPWGRDGSELPGLPPSQESLESLDLKAETNDESNSTDDDNDSSDEKDQLPDQNDAPESESPEAQIGQEDEAADEFEFPDTQVELATVHVPNSVVEDKDEDDIPNDETQKHTGKKRLTAKERRNLKKGSESNQSPVETPKQQKSPPASPKPQKQEVRGKKGKAKKLKEKYAQQDDEERALMLELLGSAKGPQPKGKKAKAEAAKKEKESQRMKKQQEIKKADSRQTEAAPGNLHDPLALPEEDQDAIKKLLEEENVILPEDDMTNMNYLDALTSQPHPDDILLHVIPVCAPWIVLQKYKYKIKLLPGSVKRGKASKAIMSTFLSMVSHEKDATSDRKKDLIKAVPDAEVVTQMMAKVKIVSALSNDKKKKK